jgi:hypothetical protein
MIGASNVISAVSSIVSLMTPTVTITGNVASGANWELTMCRTFWMTPGMTITIGGVEFKIVSFVLNTSITVSGAAQPVGTTFTLDAPEFWHGYRRKVNEERNRQMNLKMPFVYLPVPTAREDNSYDSDIAYFASIRPVFLMGYDQKLDTIDLQQLNVIEPLNEMADYFLEIIDAYDGSYNTPEDITRKEWMNFGNETVWGNDSLIFDQPLSGIEMDFSLEVLLDGLCECDDPVNPIACADVTTDFNGTATNVDTAAGQNISFNVIDTTSGLPIGTLTTNTANDKTVEVSTSTCDPVDSSFNDTPTTTDTPSGVHLDIYAVDNIDNFVGTLVTDDANNKTILVDETEVQFNGVDTGLGAFPENVLDIQVVDASDGTTPIGTLVTNTNFIKKIEVTFPTCADATVENSDLSYTNTVSSGGTLVLPDTTIEIFLDAVSQGTSTFPTLEPTTTVNLTWA